MLQYHPDLITGRNNVLALMFDMNKLWEKFVYVSLRKHKQPETTITYQPCKLFWKPDAGQQSQIKPDIVINKDREDCVVLDTKWKNLKSFNPSPDDLRQMYVYHDYFNAKRVALIYPGESESSTKSGFFLDIKSGKETKKECSIVPLPVKSDIKEWQKDINERLENWMSAPNQSME